MSMLPHNAAKMAAMLSAEGLAQERETLGELTETSGAGAEESSLPMGSEKVRHSEHFHPMNTSMNAQL